MRKCHGSCLLLLAPSQLEATPDDDAYRRIAELFQHLGLQEPLAALCRRAAASNDPDIREVAEDFTLRVDDNG